MTRQAAAPGEPGTAFGLPELPQSAFARIDEGDDAAFYAPPRLVTHIDDAAIAALGAFYARVLPPGAVLRDLMPRRVTWSGQGSAAARWMCWLIAGTVIRSSRSPALPDRLHDHPLRASLGGRGAAKGQVDAGHDGI